MKKIIIIADSRKDQFSLGDYLRIVSILPNFRTKYIYWYCNNSIKKIIKYSSHIKRIYNLDKFNYKNFEKKNYILLNLFKTKNLKYNECSVPNLLDKNVDIKFSGLDLCKKIMNKFKIKKYKIYSNKNKSKKNKYDLFINYLVPNKWKKKKYSLKNLYFIEKELKKKFNNINIIWQNKNDNIDQYFKKISSSGLILTIIGLGTHVGILFNKNIIVLSGPTFFNDLKKYRNKKIIFASDHKKWKKNLKMKDIQKEKVLNSIIIELKKVKKFNEKQS